MEKKSKLEKEAEEVPFRGMEGDTSGMSPDSGSGEQSAGQETRTDEPDYWVGMNPEDSSDTDMNKSRFAVWPSEEKGEETTTSASLKKPEQMAGSSREATEKMARVGHELHGPDEVVLPGGTTRASESGAMEGKQQKAGPGGEEFTTRVRKGDEGKHSGEWRIVSHKGEPARRQAEEDLKKRQEHDL